MSNTPLGAVMEIKEHSGWFIALGIVFIIGGAFAIIAPGLGGLAVTLAVGWSLIFVGAIEVFQSWSTRGWGGFLWNLIIGIIIFLGGLSMLINPIVGAITLTLLLGAIFIAKGVMQLIMGFQYRPNANWGWIVAAGALSALLGVLILAKWPWSTEWVLGTLAGISLIFSGWSYIMIAMASRRLSAA